MGGKGSHRNCEICGLRERHKRENKALLFAAFPLDENRCREWLRAVGNKELVDLPIEKLHEKRFICGNHFQKRDFNKKGTRLKKHAIPTLQLSAASLSDEQFIGFPQHVWKDTKGTKKRLASVPLLEDVPSTSKQAPTVGSEKSKTDVIPETVTIMKCNEAVPSTSKLDQTTIAEKSKNEGMTKKSTCLPDVFDGQDKGVKRKLEESLDLTPRKKKLIKQLEKTKCTLQSLRKSAALVEKIDSPILKEFVLNSFKNQRRNPKGRRWTTKNKISALAIFKRSPKTYRYLNKVMPLPSEKTLQNILKKVPMQPGLNKAVLNHLKNIAEDRNIKEKACCLLFDEMAIKPRLIYNMATDLVEGYEDTGDESSRCGELADHALVFMLQGLYHKFKQPIAFYFVKGTISSEKLSTLIKKIITQVSLTGFKVINTVCDQGPTNIGALKLLRDASGPREDGSNHYFVLNKEKIFIMYDIPHLFKSIRNNFQKNGTMLMNGKKARWSHLQELEEKNRNFLYLSKITPTHVEPKFRAKMKVKYAAQILSNTVAAVLKLLSQAEKNPHHANDLMDSAIVIEELDHLFDLTNGPSCHDNRKKGQRENVSSITKHLDHWTAFIKKLSNMMFIDRQGNVAKNVKCINGYITSLKSLRDIWQILSGLGFKYLNLRQLNQDALENLFGIIRQHSPTNRNPTCAHFMGALKTAIVTKLTAPHSRGSNCEKDDKNLLTDFTQIIFDRKAEDTESSDGLEGVEKINDDGCETEFPVISIPEENWLEEDDLADIINQPIVYISGYLAYKLLKNLNCEKCKNNLTADNTSSSMYSYIQLREWWKEKTSLTYPSEQLCRTVQTAVTVTETDVCPRLHERNICHMAVTMYSVKCDTKWFDCTLHSNVILKNLFTRLGLLLIRRECQRVNQGLAMKEERMADVQKKAQQQAIAK